MTMRRLAAALFLCLSAPAAAEPALWRIADADTQMTLFGTIHVLDPKTDWLGVELAAAVDGADTLVLETPLDGAGRARAGLLAEQNAYLPRGRTLAALLGPDAALLDRAAAALALDPASLQGYRPWMASLVLSLAFAGQQGQDADAGADLALMARALEAGAGLAYLETPEQQIGVFAGLPPEAERDMLLSTLREILEQPDILTQMDQAWLFGDVDTLAGLVTEGMMREAPDLYEAALAGRNRAWVEQLAAMMGPPGDIVVAVGAGHLAGPDSVLELMEARGFSIERVR